MFEFIKFFFYKSGEKIWQIFPGGLSYWQTGISLNFQGIGQHSGQQTFCKQREIIRENVVDVTHMTNLQ